MVRSGRRTSMAEVCPYAGSGCVLKFKNKEKLLEHASKCIYRLVECEGCGKRVLFKGLTYHQKVTHCVDNKHKTEVAKARKKLSEQVRTHQTALRVERVKLEKSLTRSYRDRVHERYGSSPRVPPMPRPSRPPSTVGDSGVMGIEWRTAERIDWKAKVFQNKKFDVSGNTDGESEMKGRETTTPRDTEEIIVDPRYTNPCPSRLGSEPVYCSRCQKPYWECSNHDTACAWHEGPTCQLFGGMCTACGRLDFQKGCLLGQHITQLE